MLLTAVLIVVFCGLTGGWLVSMMGDHPDTVAVTNRYSFPVTVQMTGPKEKIMPGNTYTGEEFIQGGFYCRVYDMKGKQLNKLEFTSDDIHEKMHRGVLSFDVGP